MTSRNRDTEVLPRPVDSSAELNEALAAAAPRRWWNRTTLALLGVVMLTGGFLGGVQAHERWGTESTPASAGGAVPGEPGGPDDGAGTGSPGPGGAPGGGAQGVMAADTGGTSGTVKLVDGTTLYVETADGETVTVRTGADTTVKISQAATLESITSGLTVTVEGVPDSEGIITATAVTAG